MWQKRAVQRNVADIYARNVVLCCVVLRQREHLRSRRREHICVDGRGLSAHVQLRGVQGH